MSCNRVGGQLDEDNPTWKRDGDAPARRDQFLQLPGDDVCQQARTLFLPDEEITEIYYRTVPGRVRIVAGRPPERGQTYAAQDTGNGRKIAAAYALRAAGVGAGELDDPDPRPCAPVEGTAAIEFSVEDLLDD